MSSADTGMRGHTTPADREIFGAITPAMLERTRQLPARQRAGAVAYLGALLVHLADRPEGNLSYAQVDRDLGVHRVTGWRYRQRLRGVGLLETESRARPPGHTWGRGAVRWVRVPLSWARRAAATAKAGGRRAGRRSQALAEQLALTDSGPLVPPPEHLRERWLGAARAPAETGAAPTT